MKKLLIILLIGLIIIISCGDDNSEQDQTNKVNNREIKKDLTPNEIGDKIGDTYISVMKELSKIIEDTPSPEDIKAEVEKLKEDTIKTLVELGKAREKLSESEKAIVNMNLMSKMTDISTMPEYEIYQEAVQHYNTVDFDFSSLLTEFNIITQYAQFELLKKQAPEEAERLGIE